MPEIFRFLGMRFFYFSNDHLPIHVHVKNSDGTAKFEVKPVHLVESKGMKSKDLTIAEEVISDNEDLIVKHWKNYFKDDYDTNE